MSDSKPRLKHFLLRYLEDPAYNEVLQWVDRSKLTFRVLWMHAGRATFDKDRHQKLFNKYREYRGHKSNEDPKQCFGMALKKTPSVRPIEEVADDDWRHFVFRKDDTHVSKTALQRNHPARIVRTRPMSLCDAACTNGAATHQTLPRTAAHVQTHARSSTPSSPSFTCNHCHCNLNLPPSPPDHLDNCYSPIHSPLPYSHPQDLQPLPDDLMDLDFASLQLIHPGSPEPVPQEITQPTTTQPCFSRESASLTYPYTPPAPPSPFSPHSLSSPSSPAFFSFPLSPVEFSPEQRRALWYS